MLLTGIVEGVIFSCHSWLLQTISSAVLLFYYCPLCRLFDVSAAASCALGGNRLNLQPQYITHSRVEYFMKDHFKIILYFTNHCL